MTTSWFGASGAKIWAAALGAVHAAVFMRRHRRAGRLAPTPSGRATPSSAWRARISAGHHRPQHHALLRDHAVVQPRRFVRLLAQHPPLLHQRHADRRLRLERLGAHQPQSRRCDAAAVRRPPRRGSTGRNHGVNLRSCRRHRRRLLLAGREEGRRYRGGDTKAWQAAASYDVSVAKAFGQYGKVDNKTTGNSYDIAGLGASACRWATARCSRSGARSARPVPSARPSRPATTTSPVQAHRPLRGGDERQDRRPMSGASSRSASATATERRGELTR